MQLSYWASLSYSSAISLSFDPSPASTNAFTASLRLPFLLYSSPRAVRIACFISGLNIDKLSSSSPFFIRAGTIFENLLTSCLEFISLSLLSTMLPTTFFIIGSFSILHLKRIRCRIHFPFSFFQALQPSLCPFQLSRGLSLLLLLS